MSFIGSLELSSYIHTSANFYIGRKSTINDFIYRPFRCNLKLDLNIGHLSRATLIHSDFQNLMQGLTLKRLEKLACIITQ